MTPKNITIIVVIVAVAGLLIYDGIAVLLWGYEGSISEFIVGLSFAQPIVAFLAGLLCGHLWWPYRWKHFHALKTAIQEHKSQNLDVSAADATLYKILGENQ